MDIWPPQLKKKHGENWIGPLSESLIGISLVPQGFGELQVHCRVQIPHVTGLKKFINFPKMCSCTISKNVINNSTTFENFIPSAPPEKTCGLSWLKKDGPRSQPPTP